MVIGKINSHDSGLSRKGSQVIDILEENFLNQIGLSSDSYRGFVQFVYTRFYQTNEYLFHHYMPQTHMVYVLKGQVCVYLGHQEFYGAPMIDEGCVAFPSTDFDVPHHFSCRALTKTVALLAPKKALDQWAQLFPQDYKLLVDWCKQNYLEKTRKVWDANPMHHHRIEHDLIGERWVDDSRYYGIHALRGQENFSVSGQSVGRYGHFVVALASVKKAAALANQSLGLLLPPLAEAIVFACDEIQKGAFHDQLIVDTIQGGAGTSTNMNINEVIANRALEYLGYHKGDYQHLHPLNHVNLSQSTNDVYPTAIKIATIWGTLELIQVMVELRNAFLEKSQEFASIVKMGRTQLQEAVPMTLGQEFGTYAEMLKEDIQRLEETVLLLKEISLGGTAIGTGIAAPKEFAAKVCEFLNKETGIQFSTAVNLIEATQDAGVFVQLSSVLKRTAVKISKVCNDLRLLSSGPYAGFAEIVLPPMQAGSSIMPGKINPVIPELVNQVAFLVVGHDVTITMAAEAGQLQLNAFEPIIARCLFESLLFLRQSLVSLTYRCVIGITANKKKLREWVENSIGLITAVMPKIGYEKATYIAQQALKTGQGIYQLILNENLLSQKELEDLLNPQMMVNSQNEFISDKEIKH